MKVKTRFAPSPTGNLHIGSIRTALYAWLFARHYNGIFVLRIEDTDLLRSKKESIESILTGLKWLGLDWDEGPYFQTKRLNRYKEVIKKMLQKKIAYKCFCSPQKIDQERRQQISQGEKPRYNRTCRDINKNNNHNENYVVRFKNPLFGYVTFRDQIRGNITFNNSELDDLIIQRSNGVPTYNFCSVIDDLDMNITHVIRGEDHINNTPRQINILKSLKVNVPIYAHVSMILDENKQKFSKRNHAIDMMQYRKNGFLSEALLNYIVRLGWSFGNKEIFNLSEMKKLFSLKSISKSPSIFNTKKLLWLNKYYINNLPINYISDSLKKYIKYKNINIENGPDLKSLLILLKGRFSTFKEFIYSYRYFYEEFKYLDKVAISKYLSVNNFFILKNIFLKIKNVSIWKKETLSLIINNVILDFNNIECKTVNMLLRFVLTGSICSPNITSIMFLLGKDKVLFRLKKAINLIENNMNNINTLKK